jgi:hypothetical protein
MIKWLNWSSLSATAWNGVIKIIHRIIVRENRECVAIEALKPTCNAATLMIFPLPIFPFVLSHTNFLFLCLQYPLGGIGINYSIMKELDRMTKSYMVIDIFCGANRSLKIASRCNTYFWKPFCFFPHHSSQRKFKHTWLVCYIEIHIYIVHVHSTHRELESLI